VAHRFVRMASICLTLLSCARTPETMPRESELDAWQSPAAAYNKSLDAGPSYDVAALDLATVDVPILLDVPDATAPTDVPDTLVPDTQPQDVQLFDTGPVWPSGPLQVQSAFSPDGKAIKVRFDKPVDAKSLSNAQFLITSTTGDTLGVTSAVLSTDPQFVVLTLNPSDLAKVNPAVTYKVLVKNVTAQDGQALDTGKNKANIKRTVYVALLWHQHQPTYLDPIADVLTSPWVRKHATKDYYDMAAILQQYPDVHVTINITPVMLNQLVPYYLDRLGPYVDTQKNTVDAKAFLAKWKGHTDPWVDLLLEPTPEPKAATDKQIGLFYADPWSCVSTAPVLMNRFPAYAALRDKNPATLTQEDLLGLKIYFELAWLDPDFLHGPVALPTGDVVDLTDIIAASAPTNGTFTLKVPLSEALANRIVAEEYKIMKAVVPIHKKLMYHTATQTGQIEIATTPFYHPILPLVQNTELMKQGQPFDPAPQPAFSYPQDAGAQVGRAVGFYKSLFGEAPLGMWPGEGSVAEDVVPHFLKYGIRWVATDQAVMQASGKSPGGAPVSPFMVDADKVSGDGGDTSDEMAVFFRNTSMSNDIGFKYQGMTGEDASDDLIKNVAAQAPGFGAPDRVITLVLDGENAWETFVKEHDGKGFFHALYGKLQQAQAAGEIVTVTGIEYLDGNPGRNVPAHKVTQLPELEPLFPGSWIGGNFAVWIGETEENTGWNYLLTARKDLDKSGLVMPDPLLLEPLDKTTLGYHIWKAFDEIYAAEGSDWFWWYGSDMTSPSNDDSPFDTAFRTHLAGMYQQMNAALAMQGKAPLTLPDFKPIIQANPQAPQAPLDPPPTLDGVFTPNESEWSQKGGFFFDSDTSGALANPDDWMGTIYYGFGTYQGKGGVFLGVQHNFDLTVPGNAGLAIYLSHKHIVNAATGDAVEDPATTKSRLGDALVWKGKGAARELWIGLKNGNVTTELRKSDGTANWTAIAPSAFTGKVGGPVKGGKLLEVFIPYADLGITDKDPLEVQLLFANGGKTADLAPSLEAKMLLEDPTAAMFVTFTCDVTGNALAIDTFGPISNPPPPKGKGIVYIAGNDPKLGMKAKWVPNKIALRDDGLEGDAKAGDSIWTGVFAFTKGMSIRYKYTIGLTLNEGQWGGTEEFPLTERGLEVTKDPTKKKVKVADVFADRPALTGQAGNKTTVTLE
jgi:alpha-amylase/alpha-mannosidase (GH57 family)